MHAVITVGMDVIRVSGANLGLVLISLSKWSGLFIYSHFRRHQQNPSLNLNKFYQDHQIGHVFVQAANGRNFVNKSLIECGKTCLIARFTPGNCYCGEFVL